MECKGKIQILFYEASILLILKLDTDSTHTWKIVDQYHFWILIQNHKQNIIEQILTSCYENSIPRSTIDYIKNERMF